MTDELNVLPPGSVVGTSALRGVDVTLSSAYGPIDAYSVEPAGEGPWPGVVVVHEVFGLNSHIRDVARRFANVGFHAIAPDLVSRSPTAGHLVDPSVTRAAVQGLVDREVVADLEACVDHLRGQSISSGRVGVIGFCSGGRHVLLLACSSDRPDAVIDCWGGWIHRASADDVVTEQRPTRVVDMVDGLQCPLMLVGGIEDTNPSPEMLGEVAARAEVTGQPVRVELFDGAGHAFFADYRASYRPGPAHILWARTQQFLGRHLT